MTPALIEAVPAWRLIPMCYEENTQLSQLSKHLPGAVKELIQESKVTSFAAWKA
jgi:hypothetical protein